MSWPTLWFVILGVVLAGYAILDGFDLGVGILHLGARGDAERRQSIASIGPIWDGNEVWLVVFGGALFAAFPDAYAAVFSGFYALMMGVLLGLILRAVSIEFRSKRPGRGWRATWDAIFSGSSLLTTFLFGLAVGNAMAGVPLDDRGVIHLGTAGMLRPYPLLVGALAVAAFAMHGALYLHLRTEGPLSERAHAWAWRSFGLFLVAFLTTTIATLFSLPAATRNFERWPWAWLGVAVMVLSLANVPRSLHGRRPLEGFFSSSAALAALVFLFGIGLYPDLVRSAPDPSHGLTVSGSASSELTLRIMALIAAIGMPFAVLYTVIVHRVFRGRVRADSSSSY